MEKQTIQEKLLSKSKNSQLEKFGKTITFLCIALIVFVVAMILLFANPFWQYAVSAAAK